MLPLQPVNHRDNTEGTLHSQMRTCRTEQPSTPSTPSSVHGEPRAIGAVMSLTTSSGRQTCDSLEWRRDLGISAPPDMSTLTPAIHGQGEEVHRERQTCNSIECPRDLDISAPRYQRIQCDPFCENPVRTDNSPFSQLHSSDSYPCEPDSHLNPELFQIPPPPSDLLALHEIWEHIGACRRIRNMVSSRLLI